MKTLGLDIGTKRIGLAVSDEEGIFAFPSGKLERIGRKRDLEALAQLIEEREIERVVIGIPKDIEALVAEVIRHENDAVLRIKRPVLLRCAARRNYCCRR